MANKNSFSLLSCGVAALTFSAFLLGAAGAARADGLVPRRVIFQVNAKTQTEADDAVSEIEDEYNAVVEAHLDGTYIYALQLSAGDDENETEIELEDDSRIIWAETDTYLAAPEDVPTPALPTVSGDPFHFPFDIVAEPETYLIQTAYAQIHIGQALSIATGQGITVAVLDTGVIANHAALQNRLVAGYNVMAPTALPNDAADGVTNASVGHGTMIAGLIAAVAPGAKIMPIRVLNGDGVGAALGVAQGIAFAVSHGARVINLSLSSATPSRALAAAIHQAVLANVLVVTAAGNGGSAQVCYPAALPDAMTVSAIETSGAKSDYASFGVDIAVVAPGSGIRSAYFNGGYARGSGTSFAAPFVSAEAALLFSAQPKFTAMAVRNRIRLTAKPMDALNPLYARQLGAGLIDIEKALLPFAFSHPLGPALLVSPAPTSLTRD